MRDIETGFDLSAEWICRVSFKFGLGISLEYRQKDFHVLISIFSF